MITLQRLRQISTQAKAAKSIFEQEDAHFQGFSPETLKFLRALKANNNKAWFERHRKDYEKHVLGLQKENR